MGRGREASEAEAGPARVAGMWVPPGMSSECLEEEESLSESCLSFPICEMGRCSSCPCFLPSTSQRGRRAEIKPTKHPGPLREAHRINVRIMLL